MQPVVAMAGCRVVGLGMEENEKKSDGQERRECKDQQSIDARFERTVNQVVRHFAK